MWELLGNARLFSGSRWAPRCNKVPTGQHRTTPYATPLDCKLNTHPTLAPVAIGRGRDIIPEPE